MLGNCLNGTVQKSEVFKRTAQRPFRYKKQGITKFLIFNNEINTKDFTHLMGEFMKDKLPDMPAVVYDRNAEGHYYFVIATMVQ